MDDNGFLVFPFSLFAGVLIFGLMMMAISATDDSGRNNKRQDKRYEMCLDKGMQWVEGNCIGTSK